MKRVADTSVRSRVIVSLVKLLGMILSLVLLVSVIFLVTKKDDNSLKTIRLAVASKDITGQQILTTDHISFQEFPINYSPQNGLSESQVKKLLGKKIFYSVLRGDIISPSLFGATKSDLTGGIANGIPSNMKLVYLNIEDVHTFPPDLQKNNNVDLIAVNQKNASNVTDTIAEQVPVFDIVHSKENGEDSVTQVGFLFTNTQVLRISAKLTSDWKINIVLRPQREALDSINSVETATQEGTIIPTTTEDEKE